MDEERERLEREIEGRLEIAIRVAAQHRMSAFNASLETHRRHESFGIRDWALTREMGFVCCCTGEEREYRISLRTLREILPEARQAFLAFRNQNRRFDFFPRNSKKRRLERARATKKSRALLHRFLTKQQRIELRGLQSFKVRGADDLAYKITEGGVYLVDGEKVIAGFCVVQKGHEYLPIYDLMLAHKLLLETSPAKFWALANIRDLDPPPNLSPQNYRNGWDVLPIPQADLDDPGPWIAQRLGNA